MPSQALVSWQAPTHERVHRSPDWFWALGLLAVTGAATAFLMGNSLLSIIILLGIITIVITAIKEPRMCDIRITEDGIVVENSLFPYRSLHSFWIDETTQKAAQLVVGTRSLLNPQLILPLEDKVDKEHLKKILLVYLPEEEQYETFLDRIADSIGF